MRRRTTEREMAEELRYHVEEQVARNVAAGMTPEEALRAARRQFGHLDRIQEEARDARGLRWLHDLGQDLRHAVRLMHRQRGFSVTTILIFALGLGATTAIFSVVDHVILRPLAVESPERLMLIWETNLSRQVTQFTVSYPNYQDWAERSQSWVELTAFDRRAVNFIGHGEPQQLVAEFHTANVLRALGLEVAQGRLFAPGEDGPGGALVAIVSATLGQRLADAEGEALGRSLSVDGRLYTIVGVLPPGAGLSPDVDVILPLGPIIESDRSDHSLVVMGRLKAGVSRQQAEAEMRTLAQQLEREHPETNAGWSVRLEPLFDLIVPPSLRRVLQVLMAAVALLLIITCANVAGLLLVRATGRSREFALRSALGGSRGRLVRQLVTESLLLAILGGVVGTLLAAWALEVWQTWESFKLPRAETIALDLRVLTISWTVALLAGVAAGLIPALSATRRQHAPAVQADARVSLGRQPLRKLLVVGQVALAVVLLGAAGLVVRTLQHLRQMDLGYEADSVLTVRLAPAGEAKAFWATLTERVNQLPGVVAVGLTNSPPMADLNTSLDVSPIGPSRLSPAESVQAEWRVVDTGYFEAMKIPVRRGENFAGRGAGQPARSVVLNETLARILWGEEDPIGRQVNLGGGNNSSTVVGVVADARTRDPAVAPAPGYYVSTERFVWGHMTMVIRTAQADPRTLLPMIRTEVRALDPALPLMEVNTLDVLVDRRLGTKQLVAGLLALFAGLAVTLALVGVYGLMAFTTAQRTRDSGVRLALGARPFEVVRPLLREGGELVAGGMILGVALAMLALPRLHHLLVGVSPWDLSTGVITLALVITTSFVACYLPARRAAQVDPVIALRADG